MPPTFLSHDDLQTLRRALPEAARILHLDLGKTFNHWVRTLDQKVLPRLNKDYPLTVAICGGGSAGKSTLFNALVGQPVSPVGGQAGLNRRVLLAARESQLNQAGYIQYLGHMFEEKPEALRNPNQLLKPGPALYCASNQLPDKVVLLDTPDMDTGAQGVYTNREMARQALETADLFIYLFTNATYNNLDNTNFISKMLTGMGTRPCYLVYRVYPGFTDEEVRDHAGTVAENIYGPLAKDQVLGLFRVDEDNAVAAGEQPPIIKTAPGAHQNLVETLSELDARTVRRRLMETMTTDAIEHARLTYRTIHQADRDLMRYANGLKDAQVTAVQQVLSHFPVDRVLRRFARIWMETDPTHIKWMRTTGSVVGWPLKMVTRAIRRIESPGKAGPAAVSGDTLDGQVEMDLLSAANQLYRKALERRLAVDGDQVTVPALLGSVQRQLSQQPWQEIVAQILSRKEQILSWSRQLDADLRALAKDRRQQMSFLDQARQTFVALLNVVPATVAITYILHTGDPVGATGIKIKLTGFLGLNDLYALVAIPATAGTSKADRHQLEGLLQPLAQTWLAHKSNKAQQLFESYITGTLLKTAQTAQVQLKPLMVEIESALVGTVQGEN